MQTTNEDCDTGKAVYKTMADRYDEEVKAYNSHVHDVLFGMSYPFALAEQRLLDIGIGTGLASVNFAEMGLQVYGLDSSPDMIAACRSKSFARELRICDITREPIPYEDGHFDHVVCSGVLHFVQNLDSIFGEVRRATKTGGFFAFSIAPQDTTADAVKEPTAWGIPIFKHSPAYIQRLAAANAMICLKEQRLIIKGADKKTYDMEMAALVFKIG